MACRSSFIQTYPSASCLQTGLMSLSAHSATSLPGITVGTAISTVHAFRLADYTADRDSHPALKICRCKFITIYDNSYTNILHIHKFYHTFASLNQKVYHFGYSQQQSNTAKTQCPDGGIGRRAGLKHQWSNPCRFDPGSGYKKRLRAMLGAFFFWRGGHFSCTHKGKPLSFLNPRHFVTALIRGMPPSAYASEGFSPPPEGCLHNLLKIKHASETLCSQSIILGNYISVYTNNTQHSCLPSVMTYNIETHTGFKAFLCMCVWPCVQTTRFKALWQGFKKRVLRHIQDLRHFCVCVSGSACRPCIIRTVVPS